MDSSHTCEKGVRPAVMGPPRRGRTAGEGAPVKRVTKLLPFGIFVLVVCVVGVSFFGSDGTHRLAVVEAAETEAPAGAVDYEDEEPAKYNFVEDDFVTGETLTTGKRSSSARRHRRNMSLTKAALFSTSILIIGALFAVNYYGVDKLASMLFGASSPPPKETAPTPKPPSVLPPKSLKQTKDRRLYRKVAVASAAAAMLLAGGLMYYNQLDLPFLSNLRDLTDLTGGVPAALTAAQPAMGMAKSLLSDYAYIVGALGALGLGGAGAQFVAHKRMKKMKAEVERLERQRDLALSEKDALKAHLRKVENELQEVRSELAKSRFRGVAKTASAAGFRERVKALEEKHQQAVEEIERLRREIAAKESEIGGYRATIENVKGAVSAHGEEVGASSVMPLSRQIEEQAPEDEELINFLASFGEDSNKNSEPSRPPSPAVEESPVVPQVAPRPLHEEASQQGDAGSLFDLEDEVDALEQEAAVPDAQEQQQVLDGFSYEEVDHPANAEAQAPKLEVDDAGRNVSPPPPHQIPSPLDKEDSVEEDDARGYGVTDTLSKLTFDEDSATSEGDVPPPPPLPQSDVPPPPPLP